MGLARRSRVPFGRGLGAAVLAPLFTVLWATTPALAQTTDAPTPTGSPTESPSPADADEEGPVLELAVTGVLGDGPDDGDLVVDPETGLPTLVFSPGTPAEQVAVREFTVTNVGDGALHEVAVHDDRLGVVLDATDDTTLAPGASVVVRAVDAFTFDEVAAGLAGLLAIGSEATATDEQGAEVAVMAQVVLQLVAVLPAPQVEASVTVVSDRGDVRLEEGRPTLTWSAEAIGDEEPRTIHLRVEVTNTGPVPLHDLVVAAGLDATATPAASVAVDTPLPPGEVSSVELVQEVVPGDVLPVGSADEGGPVEVDVVVTATAQGTDAGGAQSATSSDEAVVRGVLLLPTVLGEVLPATGPADAPLALVVAAGLLALGVVLLRATGGSPVRDGRRT